jgi:hypothetical protein
MPAMTRHINRKYAANGLFVHPALPAKGETVKVVYNGLLASSGADRLYVRFGFGPAWEGALDYKMVRTGSGFAAAVPVAAADSLNLCFRDSAGHWDNNSGNNYSFEVFE